MDLKPVIQESLHKAIHWKTWDQLSTVQGPLSLKQLCQMNSKGSVSTGDSARIPRVIVGHDGEWLSVSPLALHHWVSRLTMHQAPVLRNLASYFIRLRKYLVELLEYFFRPGRIYLKLRPVFRNPFSLNGEKV